MSDTATGAVSATREADGPRFLRRRLLALLERFEHCDIELIEGGRRTRLGRGGAGAPLSFSITVHDPGMWRAAALYGTVGAGEAYMDGLWDCSDLVAMIRAFVVNRALMDSMDSGLARLGGALLRLWHGLRRNSRRGSRRNIAAHYDLGNELFRLFLDDNLMYSSAVFRHDGETLEHAATRKLERICRKLDLKPGERVLEIGTGWGGFALHAAREHGVHVTTTTISKEQHALAGERIAAAGLSDRVTLLLRDYRDLEGSFDKLVSIEMIEAIGHQYLDDYFGRCSALLAPHGQALIQAITIEDHRYERAVKEVDFIKRFIFPGSFIPSIAAMTGAMARAGDLKLFHLEDIGPSYAVTLRAWRERFNARLAEVRALGYPERFIRMWNFYFAYCEGGFIERSIGDVQMLLVKPGARPRQCLPDLDPAL